MLRVFQLSLTPDEYAALDGRALPALCEKKCRWKQGTVTRAVISRRSVDARKGQVTVTLTADCDCRGDEKKLAAPFAPNVCAFVPGRAGQAAMNVWELAARESERWPYTDRPIVVGMGPAGLFCALALAARGAKPLVIERGEPVTARAASIEQLELTGQLNPESNVLFGEGGAGAFSDGKLTCGLNDPLMASVLQTFLFAGAPQEIAVQKRPHIGTDELRRVLVRLRAKLLSLGGEVRFGVRLTDLVTENGSLRAIRVRTASGADELPCAHLFLATGHSARDTYRMLRQSGVPMERKPFAIGLRIEHPRAAIDRAQYGRWAGHAALPSAEYKLNVPTPDGRGVYTFCMCPGGRVINASHDPGHLNVNGMSLHARDGENSNAALLVGVSPADFGEEDDVLGGLLLQERIEAAAFIRAGGTLRPICQRVGDFLAKRETTAFGGVLPSYRPGVTMGRVDAVLPAFVCENLTYALPKLSQRLHGFDLPDALLTAPETRSSSPVRVCRSESGESALKGLYPLGEGAGYAGGIMSSAVDGLRMGLHVG